MAEQSIQNRILKAFGALRGVRLFRQNSATGWVGKVVKHTREILILADPKPLRAGLCVGSSDIIGWTEVKVTTDMVGQTLAVFTAVEVKQPGKYPTEEQRAFIAAVQRSGGKAGVARSNEDAAKIIGAEHEPTAATAADDGRQGQAGAALRRVPDDHTAG